MKAGLKVRASEVLTPIYAPILQLRKKTKPWFLRADCDDALEQIRVLKGDVNELIDIFRKHSIEVPVHIQERIQLDTPLE